MSSITESMRGAPDAYGVEAVCEAVLGLAALTNGLALVLDPGGAASGLSTGALAHSPFTDFFAPGLLLAVFIGGLNLFAATLTVRHNDAARAASFIAGGATLVFVLVEAAMIPGRPLQLIIAGLALVILSLAFPRKMRR